MRVPLNMRNLFILLSCSVCASLTAQPRVLHFTKTSGFDHNTRAVSFAMFTSIATELGVQVDDDATGNTFSDPDLLAQYDVIVFANTSGDAILDAAQRAHFEGFIANGGSVLGIHAATDTYRHSTANGSNTGTWDFYAELIGASVQQSPNHVSGTPLYAMTHVGEHASTADLPDPWEKNEEYYYWLNGYYGANNTEVLRVEGTIGPNGLVNDYDAPRPMSWYRTLSDGGRLFYTALGHASGNYTNDVLFRTHVRDALGWLLEGTTTVKEILPDAITLFPNPAESVLFVNVPDVLIGSTFALRDAMGRDVVHGRVSDERMHIDLAGVAPGMYALRVGNVPAVVVTVQR